MVELGGFLPGCAGLVEVFGPGSGAGAEIECLTGLVGDLVGVCGRGPLALVAVLHLDVGALGVGRSPDAGGVGVSQSHVAAGGKGGGLGSGVGRGADGGESGQHHGEQAEADGAGGTESLGSGEVANRLDREGSAVGTVVHSGLLNIELTVQNNTTDQRERVGFETL